MDVLASMFNDHKSCMGVLHDGKLVGNISISDLREFSPAMHAYLLQPVGNFLLAIKQLPAPQVLFILSSYLLFALTTLIQVCMDVVMMSFWVAGLKIR